jgi:hypothetical protein
MRADRALKKIERDREKRARAIFWDNQRLVYNSDMHAAKEKGRQEGRMASREEIARNMKAEATNLKKSRLLPASQVKKSTLETFNNTSCPAILPARP